MSTMKNTGRGCCSLWLAAHECHCKASKHCKVTATSEKSWKCTHITISTFGTFHLVVAPSRNWKINLTSRRIGSTLHWVELLSFCWYHFVSCLLSGAETKSNGLQKTSTIWDEVLRPESIRLCCSTCCGGSVLRHATLCQAVHGELPVDRQTHTHRIYVLYNRCWKYII